MCYTGRCKYESYPYGTNEGCECTCGPGDGCPMDAENPCPHCGKEMEEGLIADGSGGNHRELPAWYCSDCDYSEARDD